MNRIVAVALILSGVALPVCAQQAAARGSFSGHSASAIHHSFTASPSLRSPGLATGSHRAGPGYATAHSGSPSGNHYRRPYHGSSVVGLPYTYARSVELVDPDYNSGYPGSSDNSGNTDSSTPPANTTAVYDLPPQPQYQIQSGDRPAYKYSAEITQPTPQPTPSNDAVTLVFNDGRPAEQIHNYMVTTTMIYIQDQPHRQIPLDQLDLAATQKANLDAGIDFHFPGDRKY